MNFDFSTAGRIRFGSGISREAGLVLRETGVLSVCVITGKNPERYRAIFDSFDEAGLTITVFSIGREPTLDDTRGAVFMIKTGDCEGVISIGGGSVLDLGKAAALLASNSGDPLDYIEGIGRGIPIIEPSLPFVAVPTTAGTGSEVTKNAVLKDMKCGVKASLRSSFLLPHAALVDPDLLSGIPRNVIAATGMDALVQLTEPLVSNKANPLVDGIAREGLMRSARSLVAAYDGDDSPRVREDLAFASVCGGMALANSGLGAVHGLASAVGGMFDVPHGALCAVFAAPVAEITVRALRSRAVDDFALSRYAEIADVLHGSSPGRSKAEDAANEFRRMAQRLSVRKLASFGIAPKDIPEITKRARASNAMKAHPVVLEDEELGEILEAVMH